MPVYTHLGCFVQSILERDTFNVFHWFMLLKKWNGACRSGKSSVLLKILNRSGQSEYWTETHFNKTLPNLNSWKTWFDLKRNKLTQHSIDYKFRFLKSQPNEGERLEWLGLDWARKWHDSLWFFNSVLADFDQYVNHPRVYPVYPRGFNQKCLWSSLGKLFFLAIHLPYH